VTPGGCGLGPTTLEIVSPPLPPQGIVSPASPIFSHEVVILFPRGERACCSCSRGRGSKFFLLPWKIMLPLEAELIAHSSRNDWFGSFATDCTDTARSMTSATLPEADVDSGGSVRSRWASCGLMHRTKIAEVLRHSRLVINQGLPHPGVLTLPMIDVGLSEPTRSRSAARSWRRTAQAGRRDEES
jgi:hypothetical protein